MKLTKRLAKMYRIDVTNIKTLESWEKNGYDVSEFKDAAIALAAARKEARELYDKMHPVDLGRLSAYIATPRDPESEFVSDAVASGASGKLFASKAKERQIVANSPLIYGAVVQANNALWEPGHAMRLPAVLVITTDEAYKNDIAWLTQMAATIGELRSQGNLPKDMRKLIDDLRNSISSFCHKVGTSVAGGADVWCATVSFDQSDLPGTRIPKEGILPFLLREPPKENKFIQMTLVPAKYYAD
ncbi:MAG: hypothetical protein FWD65_02345 [Coriobacteriia bacterium]|nr:hypothetical protein [Coriobacteriia bacterium]